jgi:hypothetical protein
MSDEPELSNGRPEVEIAQDGRRIVRWWAGELEGKPLMVEHDFPDAVEHHYRPRGLNEDVPLYRGSFYCGDDRPFEGDVRLRWFPSPRIEARGSRPTTSQDFLGLFSGPTSALWVDSELLSLELDDGALPVQPTDDASLAESAGHSVTPRVEQELGSPDALDEVTFLVPNGWQSHDAGAICAPDDLTRYWHGRTACSGDGWDVTFDRCYEMDLDAWRELKDAGGSRYTHVGRLRRADRATFVGDEAFRVLDRIRVALNIALGRRTTCSLPVGWREGMPVWTRWRSAPVGAYRTTTHWLDETVASKQVSDIVGRVLDFTADPFNWEALRPAVAYYVAANVDVDVELSVAVPVSALQLLAFFRLVSQRGTYSKGKWDKLSTEKQVQLLLADINADTAVHPHFQYLTNVCDRLAQDAPRRNALGVVVKMRNVVTHPTRDKPATFDIYEWAEAGMHARYWLCLALLNTVGYHGDLARTLEEKPRMTGQLRPPPWTPTAVPSPPP